MTFLYTTDIRTSDNRLIICDTSEAFVAMDDNEVIEPETLAEQFIQLGIDTSIEVGIQKFWWLGSDDF